MLSKRRFATICAASLGLLAIVTGPSVMVARALHHAEGPALTSTRATEARLTSMVAAAAASTKEEIQAEILPAATFAVGTSLSGGPDGKTYGVGLTANDISNAWTTCKGSCTLDFVFFVFSNEQEKTNVEFKVESPSAQTVYHYTWSSKLDSTNWYSVYAKGDYSSAGTYFAEVYVAGTLQGWVPVVFTKS